jgi:hypothetical protein
MLLAVGPGLGLPVMHRPDDLLATDCASGADPVFHHEGLAQNALEMSVYDAANGLGLRSGGERIDDSHGVGGVTGLGGGPSQGGENAGSQNRATADHFSILPSFPRANCPRILFGPISLDVVTRRRR